MTVIAGVCVGAKVAVGTGSACSGVAVGPQPASSNSSENPSTAIMNKLFSDGLYGVRSGPIGISGCPAHPHCRELKDLAILRIHIALSRRESINVGLFAIFEFVNIQAPLKDSADRGFVYPDLEFGLDPVSDLVLGRLSKGSCGLGG